MLNHFRTIGFCVVYLWLSAFEASNLFAANKASETKLVNQTPELVGNFEEGKLKSEEYRCQECHGKDGNGQGQSAGSAGKFAKLSGQYSDYLQKQIRDFRTGQRKQDLMLLMARSIDDQDAADIAVYFAEQKSMAGNVDGYSEAAERLFTQGDPARQIPACESCHGKNGKGISSALAPVIGGQEWLYLDKQLQEWRSGERHNSPSNIMNTITNTLSDAELKQLSDYISGL